MAQKKPWMRSGRAPRPAPLDASEKAVIVAACEAFIGDVLKPRFLPQIRPTQWNYVIDIHGAWARDDTASCSATGRAWSTIAATSSMRPSPDRPYGAGSFRYLLDEAHGQMVAPPCRRDACRSASTSKPTGVPYRSDQTSPLYVRPVFALDSAATSATMSEYQYYDFQRSTIRSAKWIVRSFGIIDMSADPGHELDELL